VAPSCRNHPPRITIGPTARHRLSPPARAWSSSQRWCCWSSASSTWSTASPRSATRTCSWRTRTTWSVTCGP